MSKHTSGLWATRNGRIFPVGKEQSTIASISRDIQDWTLFNEDDARRIVACVNACAGMETEILENIAMLGETLLDRFELRNRHEAELTSQINQARAEAATWEQRAVKEASDNADLVQQRGELLAALETLYKDCVRVMEAGRDRIRDLGGHCDPIDVMERGDPGLIDARKAIAKAKGGAA